MAGCSNEEAREGSITAFGDLLVALVQSSSKFLQVWFILLPCLAALVLFRHETDWDGLGGPLLACLGCGYKEGLLRLLLLLLLLL